MLLRLENNVRAYTTETLWMQACLNLIYLLPGFVTQDARAFVLGAVCSFAGVAVFYCGGLLKVKRKRPLCAVCAPMPTFTGRHCLTALCWHLQPS